MDLMSASTKLATAIQALCHLAGTSSISQNSDLISQATGIHASRLRNILSMLARAGIVNSERGLSGGFKLAKQPEQIHLQEVYCAVETKKAFHLDITKEGTTPAELTTAVNGYFLGLFDDIQVEIEEKMRNITLLDVLNSIDTHSPTLPSSVRG